MEYPTKTEAKAANLTQLCRWQRFLPSPGWGALNESVSAADAEAAQLIEVEVLDIIMNRIARQGGITPSISKELGW